LTKATLDQFDPFSKPVEKHVEELTLCGGSYSVGVVANQQYALAGLEKPNSPHERVEAP